MTNMKPPQSMSAVFAF